MRSGTLYAQWKRANPREAVLYEAYADSVTAEDPGYPPALVTKTGRALVLAGRMGTSPVGWGGLYGVNYGL